MPKRLIVCSDGTWNTRKGGKPTNVEKMAQAICPTASDGTTQIVFYDQGIGTGDGVDRWLGGAFGIGLSQNIEDAYRFLVDNYADGDQVYMFGFSRGAYTSRSTVGMLRKCGLLRKGSSHRFGEAYALYRQREGGADSPAATAFREKYSTDIKVTCLGVWDTVGSLGIPGHLGSTILGRTVNKNAEFHDVKISTKVVEAGYQALAIDEQRRSFEPAIWWREAAPEQTLEQAWFSGFHSDVGGGNVSWAEAEARGSIADVSFMWMVDRAKRHGLEFDEEYLRARIRPNPLAAIHQSRTGIFGLLPGRDRKLLAFPEDPALTSLLGDRRKKSPNDDPLLRPTEIQSPQTIDDSAFARWAADASYRPKNLRDHAMKK